MMAKMSTEVETRNKVKVTPRNDLTPPPKFKVIFMNDNVTTVEFVLAVLQELFDHDFDSAQALTIKINAEGSASVAILPYEIAESKAVETTLLARTNSFPLNVKIEPES
jgi:ATP-dependent Clp protease adaptor protein ClpS